MTRPGAWSKDGAESMTVKSLAMTLGLREYGQQKKALGREFADHRS